MRILTKRNLLLGNAVLGLVFAVVAFCAVRPLFQAGVKIEVARTSRDQSPAGRTQHAEKEHHLAMLNEYTRAIKGNDIFVAKVPKPEPPKKVVKAPPLKEPPWTLAGIWEPESGIWEATIIDKSKRRGSQELVARVGSRFAEYMVVITEVTSDYVRYEIRDEKYNRIVERFLPPSAAKRAGPLQKDWSKIIKAVRTNNYAVDMVKFVAECKELAGEDGDWIEMLINTVKAEPYRPGGQDAPLQGYKVLNFKPDSPLDELGVERQDIIVGLVKEPITGETQARGLLTEALEQDEVRLHINRLGKPVYIVIKLSRF